MRLASVILLAACGDNRLIPAHDETLQLVSGGIERTVIVHVPKGYGDSPLVLSLHGSGGVAANFAPLDAAGEHDGFIIAYLQAAIPLGGGFQWHVPNEPLVDDRPAPPDAPDDVAYARDVISAIDERFGVDHTRVYATGFSGGARMTSQLGCDLPDIVAIAPIAGVRFPGPCATSGVSVIAFHGTADQTNPYDGNGKPYWTYSVPQAMADWADYAGCAPMPTISEVAPNAQRSHWEGCRGSIELYTLVGEGHQLPAAVDAIALMWDVFRAHSLLR